MSRPAFRGATLLVATASLFAASGCSDSPGVTEFCLDGEFDLGARYQGMHPAPGESYPTRFCYVVEDGSDAVMFVAEGQSNPDMEGDWSVSYFPPDTVRIVNRDSPPDIEFAGASVAHEALRLRRMDPRRLVAEIDAHPEWVIDRKDDGRLTLQYPGSPFPASVTIDDGRLREFVSAADIPLRGRVPVVMSWHWPDDDSPELRMKTGSDVVFVAKGSWRTLGAREADALWTRSGGQEPVQVPGDRWPARIDLQITDLGQGAHLVSGVRTGFAHLVVETAEGLVVGDAPAGWVELHQVPPADLVPGYGISGLSENFIDFLREQFPETPIRAVAITHAHDDHAGGARAFAAAGAEVYAPQPISDFLANALNRSTMPDDRLSAMSGNVEIIPVADKLVISEDVELLVLPTGPHVDSALGILATKAGIFYQSDLHVPRSDDDTPRLDRAVSECWFAAWATANLPPDVIVVNSHTAPRTPVARLAKYLESAACGGQSGLNGT